MKSRININPKMNRMYHNVFPTRDGYKGQKMENGKLITCFATTALRCARLLNYKCREANFPIPNPVAGFEAPARPINWEPKMSESGYFYVHFVPSRNGYAGQKMENGKAIRCFAKTALSCAMKLNFKCREANIAIPNPEVGFAAPGLEVPRSGYYNVHFRPIRNGYGAIKTENGKTIRCFAKTALSCAMKLNSKCREANISIPNPEVGFAAPKKPGKSGYYNVNFQPSRNGYGGMKKENGKTIRSYAKTALSCAMKLNFKCREAGVTIPNVNVGFQDPTPMRSKKRVSSKKPIKKSRAKKVTKKQLLEH